MSDTRRAANALVERRSERFESRHGAEASRERVTAALARVGATPGVQWALDWPQPQTLEVSFAPSRATFTALHTLAGVLFALVAATVLLWVLPEQPAELRYLALIATLLAMFGMPLMIVGLGSRRAADEARIRKAIRVALLDEEPGFPPAQRWADED